MKKDIAIVSLGLAASCLGFLCFAIVESLLTVGLTITINGVWKSSLLEVILLAVAGVAFLLGGLALLRNGSRDGRP
jgi:hypothetical protein